MNFIERFWGGFVSIEKGDGYQVKRLILKPGKRISLQKHLHRSEHWVIASGVARVVLDDDEVVLRSGESTYVSVGCVHRLENIGKIDLEIIEVQMGEYLGEDDIERLADDFGRIDGGEKFKPQVKVDERRSDKIRFEEEEFCVGPEC